MKKLVVCMGACLILAFNPVSADETGSLSAEARVENYISAIYSQIDFSRCGQLSYQAFDKACRGYLNLRSAGKLNTEKEILSICDFSLPSTENRLWIIDLAGKKVLFNTYVAHGQGSGEDFAAAFSNNINSHQSSLGFYITGDTYEGEHGTSLRLAGMDEGFNDAAFDRGIVVHGAEYVCNKFVCTNQRLGRSWGCPAVPAKLALPIINTIKDSTCLFIYYPDNNYLESAYWINKRVTSLPQSTYGDIPARAITEARPKNEYITNGKTDNVKIIPLATETKYHFKADINVSSR